MLTYSSVATGFLCHPKCLFSLASSQFHTTQELATAVVGTLTSRFPSFQCTVELLFLCDRFFLPYTKSNHPGWFRLYVWKNISLVRRDSFENKFETVPENPLEASSFFCMCSAAKRGGLQLTECWCERILFRKADLRLSPNWMMTL